MALQTNTATARIRGERSAIGAVVAMVAAARMARGGWMVRGQMAGRGPEPRGVCHWGFGAYGVRSPESAACGDFWDEDCFDWEDECFDDSSHLLKDVDCPDCLAIARRVGLLKEVK